MCSNNYAIPRREKPPVYAMPNCTILALYLGKCSYIPPYYSIGAFQVHAALMPC